MFCKLFAKLQLQQQSQWAVLKCLTHTPYLVNSLFQAAYEAIIRLIVCLQQVSSVSIHVCMQLVAT